MAERKQCEFQLIRYVPDPVRNEFVNIGVLLFSSDGASVGGQSGVRFTRNWGRVHCLDPDADTQMLEALEVEIGHRLVAQPPDHPKPIRAVLEASFSNGVQITESKAYLAESFVTGLEELMRWYVDPPKRERKQRRGGRTALKADMRRLFEDAGVLGSLLVDLPVAQYTRPGDPLRIDFSYANGMVKMFHAVSLESGVDEAKVLAFAALKIREGVQRVERKKLELHAVVEPVGWSQSENEPDPERSERYEYAVGMMEEQQIVVVPISGLSTIAAGLRRGLNTQKDEGMG